MLLRRTIVTLALALAVVSSQSRARDCEGCDGYFSHGPSAGATECFESLLVYGVSNGSCVWNGEKCFAEPCHIWWELTITATAGAPSTCNIANLAYVGLINGVQNVASGGFQLNRTARDERDLRCDSDYVLTVTDEAPNPDQIFLDFAFVCTACTDNG